MSSRARTHVRHLHLITCPRGNPPSHSFEIESIWLSSCPRLRQGAHPKEHATWFRSLSALARLSCSDLMMTYRVEMAVLLQFQPLPYLARTRMSLASASTQRPRQRVGGSACRRRSPGA